MPPSFSLSGSGLALELDAMVAEDVGPHIGFRGNLHVRMTELEDDLRIADRKAVFVRNAAAQDECVVVQPEVLGIDEQHFTDLDRLGVESGDSRT